MRSWDSMVSSDVETWIRITKKMLEESKMMIDPPTSIVVTVLTKLIIQFDKQLKEDRRRCGYGST